MLLEFVKSPFRSMIHCSSPTVPRPSSPPPSPFPPTPQYAPFFFLFWFFGAPSKAVLSTPVFDIKTHIFLLESLLAFSRAVPFPPASTFTSSFAFPPFINLASTLLSLLFLYFHYFGVLQLNDPAFSLSLLPRSRLIISFIALLLTLSFSLPVSFSPLPLLHTHYFLFLLRVFYALAFLQDSTPNA